MNSQPTSFFGLGIAPGILEVLNKLKFSVPTPIQHKAIPIGIDGKDIIGIAQTGTGKTLAFAIPMVQRLAQKSGIGLVLVPTRELALQVDETYRKIEYVFGLKSVVLIGGASMHEQTQALRKRPRIIIATPGRYIDHLSQWNIVSDEINVLVLDEADRMLDMGFLPQIERILRFVPKERQTMLFAATMPSEIVKIATSNMKLPVSVEIAPPGTVTELVTQEMFIVSHELKGKLLGELLKQYTGSVLLFIRTKIGAHKVTRMLRTMGYIAGEIHADRSLSQRKEALHGFKSGKYRILVATDIAARGIDVTGIELVINYDLPDDPENYIHRIGRTGRAGKEGHAIAFATPDQEKDVRSIEKIMRSSIPVAKHPVLPPQRFSTSPKTSPDWKRRPRQQNKFRDFQGRGAGKNNKSGGFSRFGGHRGGKTR